MNHKRLISLTVYWMLVIVSSLCVLSFANNQSGTNIEAEQHLQKANELRMVSDYEAAITEFETVISLSPNSEIAQNAQYWIGQLYSQTGQFDAALSAFQKLIDEYPASTIIPATTFSIERVQQAQKSLALFKAARNGDVEQVKLLISQGTEVDTKDEAGWTALFWATSAGQTDVAEFLINNGADINSKDELNNTALHIAVEINSDDIVEFLIEQGADLNAKNNSDQPPLFFAVWYRNTDMVNLLISKGADINITLSAPTYSLLRSAMGTGYLDTVRLFVEHGAKFDVRREDGLTDLQYALEGLSSRDRVEFFISKIVDLSSLYMAAFTGNLARVQELIDQGIDIDAKDEAGWTALFWASCAGQTNVAELLINNGADVNVKSPGGDCTPLNQAAKFGEPGLVELLVSKGAEVDVRDNMGGTPLGYAASSGQIEVAEFLIENGADVNARNNLGGGPLLAAVRFGHQEMVELLISKGADVTIQSLNLAQLREYYEIVGLLREYGSESLEIVTAPRGGMRRGGNGAESSVTGTVPLRRDGVGAMIVGSPLHQAVGAGDIELLKQLISEGADVNAKIGSGHRPLHFAALMGNKEITELLINNSADVNAQNDIGNTALHSAVGSGHRDIVEILLANGADVNITNGSGLTPLGMAQAEGRTEIVELLREYGSEE